MAACIGNVLIFIKVDNAEKQREKHLSSKNISYNLGGLSMELNPQWNDLTKRVIDKLQSTFKSCPHCFFSEHDIHSSLFSIAKKQLEEVGVDSQTTSDGYTTSLAHHEYPTPFRCDMHGNEFRLPSREEERTQKGGLYKRGHYDLVIFNPEFIRKHTLDAVSGKDYQKLRAVLPKLNNEPLIWTCEIIYFPVIRKLPENAVKIVEQDTSKVRATLDYKIGENKKFCKIGSVHVFTSFPKPQFLLEREMATLAKKHKIEITLTTA